MKKIILLLLAVLWLGATTGTLWAQTNAARTRAIFVQTNSITATVEDIDYDHREITLKGPDGRSMRFGVSDQVKRFSQIKKGDEVRMSYYQAAAIALAKPGSTLPPTGGRTVVLSRGPGQRPAASAMAVTELTATVEDVDRDKREVTLRGPRGNVVTVEVDPEVGDLEQIHKGDQIAVSYTEALAISVQKP